MVMSTKCRRRDYSESEKKYPEIVDIRTFCMDKSKIEIIKNLLQIA